MARWPRKNDPESIRARQEALGLNGEVTAIDLAPFAKANEMLTGAAVLPVSVVGPLDVDLGEYELEEPFGRLAETGRVRDQVYVPLAHTEGGLSASLYRGARAAAESGGFRTYVLGDRITRASCFVCKNTEEAVRRVLRTTVGDLLELSFAGTHGAVASGMQSVAFTPASAIAAIFAATGQDLGMVGTSSMVQATARTRTSRGSNRRNLRESLISGLLSKTW